VVTLPIPNAITFHIFAIFFVMCLSAHAYEQFWLPRRDSMFKIIGCNVCATPKGYWKSQMMLENIKCIKHSHLTHPVISDERSGVDVLAITALCFRISLAGGYTPSSFRTTLKNKNWCAKDDKFSVILLDFD
jgi:hypothetical protein